MMPMQLHDAHISGKEISEDWITDGPFETANP